jgi:16S rRNA (guanine527-N7)-methyltransferase
VSTLKSLLIEARDQGFFGDQPIERQIEHAKGFLDVYVAALQASQPPAASDLPHVVGRSGTLHRETRLLDLGAGGGLPGLVLGLSVWPFAVRTLLLDGSVRRAEWLRYAVTELDLAETVEVIEARAEIAGRLPEWRQRQSVVVARSFGRPGVTAECAAPFLDVGGALVVSEPPAATGALPPSQGMPSVAPEAAAARCSGAEPVAPSSSELGDRWPPDRLAELGFAPAAEWRARGYRYAVLWLDRLCPERYPRRNGIPAKRPLF